MMAARDTTLSRENELTMLILKYFDEPKRSWNMHEDERFEGFTRYEIQKARLSANRAGLLKRTGRTGASEYWLSETGEMVLGAYSA